MDINYSAIKNSSVYEKSKKMLELTGKSKLRTTYMYVGSFFGLCVLFAIVVSYAPILIPIPLLIVAIGVIKLVANIKKGRGQWMQMQAALAQFARDNEFSYKEAPYVQLTNEDVPEVKWDLPFKAKLITNSGYLTGTLHGFEFEYVSGMLELQGYTGITTQNNGPENRTIAAMCVTLPKEMPTLFIDTKRNNLGGFEAKANNIEEVTRYTLEGNFPDHYNVYAQQNTHIDVLSVLSPEVMQKLLDYTHYDVWIKDSKLVVYSLDTPYEYFAGTPSVFETTVMLLHEIDRIARAMSADA